jgi:putative endonuclease
MAKTGHPDRGNAAEKRGRSSETLAALLLRCKFYRILGRRVRTRAGEIDLVAQSPSGVICFVEVKARPDAGLASQAMSTRQRQRIVRAAAYYLAGRTSAKGVRFDVVSVVPGRVPRHSRDVWRADE